MHISHVPHNVTAGDIAEQVQDGEMVSYVKQTVPSMISYYNNAAATNTAVPLSTMEADFARLQAFVNRTGVSPETQELQAKVAAALNAFGGSCYMMLNSGALYKNNTSSSDFMAFYNNGGFDDSNRYTFANYLSNPSQNLLGTYNAQETGGFDYHFNDGMANAFNSTVTMSIASGSASSISGDGTLCIQVQGDSTAALQQLVDSL